jgi:hypothetical protein
MQQPIGGVTMLAQIKRPEFGKARDAMFHR